MADGAFLYVYGSSNNNYYDVPNLYNNYDVKITSKSYSNGCNAGYTSLAQDLDEQINLYLLFMFSLQEMMVRQIVDMVQEVDGKCYWRS